VEGASSCRKRRLNDDGMDVGWRGGFRKDPVDPDGIFRFLGALRGSNSKFASSSSHEEAGATHTSNVTPTAFKTRVNTLLPTIPNRNEKRTREKSELRLLLLCRDSPGSR
jgi:hypothetical protein